RRGRAAQHVRQGCMDERTKVQGRPAAFGMPSLGLRGKAVSGRLFDRPLFSCTQGHRITCGFAATRSLPEQWAISLGCLVDELQSQLGVRTYKQYVTAALYHPVRASRP